LHDEKLYGLYSLANSIWEIKSRRRMRWGGEGNMTRMGETRCAYKDLVRKPEVKRPLGRTVRKSKYKKGEGW
jgi:hypothetical protein